MGDNQSDNWDDWYPKQLVVLRDNIKKENKMGHYDSAYEYDEDKTRLTKAQFDAKYCRSPGDQIDWPNPQPIGPVKNCKTEPEVLDYHSISGVTEVRFSVNEKGKGFIVIDVEDRPTYRIEVGRKITNTLLSQILSEKNNG